jgi:hypothetical protein
MNTKRLFNQVLQLSKTRNNFNHYRFLSTNTPWHSNMKNDKTCWQCQSTNEPSALFCENKVCKVIQPIPSQLNFYDLLQAGTGEEK